jgi:hypothetical protein
MAVKPNPAKPGFKWRAKMLAPFTGVEFDSLEVSAKIPDGVGGIVEPVKIGMIATILTVAARE